MTASVLRAAPCSSNGDDDLTMNSSSHCTIRVLVVSLGSSAPTSESRDPRKLLAISDLYGKICCHLFRHAAVGSAHDCGAMFSTNQVVAFQGLEPRLDVLRSNPPCSLIGDVAGRPNRI